MKIKQKLSLSVSLLFLLIVVLIGIGAGCIGMLSSDTNAILADNYQSIRYAEEMMQSLESLPDSENAKQRFLSALLAQERNITETGESAATQTLRNSWEALQRNPGDNLNLRKTRESLYRITELNMNAIGRKNAVANQTAKTATLIIGIAGTLCFLLAFTLLLNLPSSVADPLRELSAGVKAIAERNYSARLHFSRKDELGEVAESFNQMAEKLQEYDHSDLAELMNEKKRIETLINSMQEPVIGLDEKECILFMNDRALNICGLKQEETTGKAARNVAARNDLLRSLIQEKGPENQELNILKIFADGKESFFQKERIPITIQPVNENAPRHIGTVIILQNITPFKELDNAKTHFIATISHELKTPISSQLMTLGLMQNEKTGSLNPEQKHLLDSMREDSMRLLRITAELLDLAQVESGNIQLHMQACDPLAIIRLATEAVKVQAEGRNVRIEGPENPSLPIVLADPDKTAWVLVNLLSNAIRYSQENTIVTIQAQPGQDQLCIQVSDKGKGIEARYLEKIFDRYFQVPGSLGSGTGLGLAISKEFIEAQGGKITVTSDVGKGSSFSIYVKLAENTFSST